MLSLNNENTVPSAELPNSSLPIRIEVSLAETPIVSYAKLYKYAVEKINLNEIHADTPLLTSGIVTDVYDFGKDPFFDKLLANAAHYDEEDEVREGFEISEGNSEDEKQVLKRKRRRPSDIEGYDVNELYLDDSELFISGLGLMKPKHGFFVYKGPLEFPSNYEENINSSNGFESFGPSRKVKKNGTNSKITVASSTDSEPVKKNSQIKGKSNIKRHSNDANSMIIPTKGSCLNGDAVEGTNERKGENGDLCAGTLEQIFRHSESKHSNEPISLKEEKTKRDKCKNGKSRKQHKVKDHKYSLEKKRIGSLPPLPPSVEILLVELKEAAEKENFENKAKFPSTLRPMLARIVSAYMSSTDIAAPDEDLIMHLTSILPYNRFTLKKLSTKIILQERLRILEVQFEELFGDFSNKVKIQMKLMLEQYGEANKHPGEEKDGFNVNRSIEFTESTIITKELDGNVNHNSKLDTSMSTTDSIFEDRGSASNEDKLKKFRWNEELRRGLYQVMRCEMEITNLKNELLELEGHSVKPLSETNQRKAVYQKILIFFEPGWTTSYEISREYSLYKRRVDKRSTKELPKEETSSQKRSNNINSTESHPYPSKQPSSPGKKRCVSGKNGGKSDSRSKVYKILSEMSPSLLSDSDSADYLAPPIQSKKSSHGHSYTYGHKPSILNTAPTVIDYNDITITNRGDEISGTNTDSSISSSSISSGPLHRSSGAKKKHLTATETFFDLKKRKEEKAVDELIAKRKRQMKRKKIGKEKSPYRYRSGHKTKEPIQVKDYRESTNSYGLSVVTDSYQILNTNNHINNYVTSTLENFHETLASAPIPSSASKTQSSSLMDVRNLIA